MRGAFGDNAVFRVSIPLGVTLVIGCLATVFVLRKGAQYCSQKLQHKRNQRNRESCPQTPAIGSAGKCYVCSAKLLTTADNSPSVKCAGCTHDICQSRSCAIWLPEPSPGVWNCKLCNSFMRGGQTACDWFMRKINQRLVATGNAGGADNVDNVLAGAEARNVVLTWNESDETLVVPVEQRDVVREYIERLVASMVGGDTSLDRVPIGQLYSNLNYLKLFSLYHLPLSRIFHSLEKSIHLKLCLPQLERNAAPPLDESYENLRRLVEQIIEQVFKIPELLDCSGVPGRSEARAADFDPKKYEELLATAVLNRIVEKFEREQKVLHSRRDWAEDPLGWNSREGQSDCSSDEPRSDSSYSGLQRRRPMSINVESAKDNFNSPESPAVPRSPTSDEEYLSDYIQNHRVPLPHLDAENNRHNPDEEFQSFEANGHGPAGHFEDGGADGEGAESWQNNWMFKKRKASGDLTSVSNSSIGMLVPSPTEEVKALIGDRTADEVSDLSEAGSDAESELSDDENGPAAESQPANDLDVPHVIVESKTLIGGKNEVESFHQTLLLQPASLTTDPLVLNSTDDLLIENQQEKNKEVVVEDFQQSLKAMDDVVAFAEGDLIADGTISTSPIIVDVLYKPTERDEVLVPVAAPRKKSVVLPIDIPVQPTEAAQSNCSLVPIANHALETKSINSTSTATFETLKHQLVVEIPNSSFVHHSVDVDDKVAIEEEDSPAPIPLPSLNTHPLFMKHLSIDPNVDANLFTDQLRSLIAIGTPSPTAITINQHQLKANHIAIIAPFYQQHALASTNPTISVCQNADPAEVAAAEDAEAANLDSLSEAEASIVTVVEQKVIAAAVELEAIDLVQSIVATIEQRGLPQVEKQPGANDDTVNEESKSINAPIIDSSAIVVETLDSLITEDDVAINAEGVKVCASIDALNQDLSTSHVTAQEADFSLIDLSSLTEDTVHDPSVRKDIHVNEAPLPAIKTSSSPIQESLPIIETLPETKSTEAKLNTDELGATVKVVTTGGMVEFNADTESKSIDVTQSTKITESTVTQPITIEIPVLADIKPDTTELAAIDNLIVIATPPEEYLCKVKPTEYDISMDEATKAYPTISPSDEQNTLIAQILPDAGLVEDTTVPKGILISTTPAMVALDLASEAELLAVESQDEGTTDDSPNVSPSIPEEVSIDESVYQTPSSSLSNCSEFSNAPVSTSVTELHTNIDLNEHVVPLTTNSQKDESLESPLKIPVVIVTESAEQTIGGNPTKTLVKQSSLEIPTIDSRENFDDLMKSPVVVSTEIDASTKIGDEFVPEDNDADFVIVSDAEVAALKFEEETSKTVIQEVAAKTITNIDNEEIVTSSTDTLSITTNITQTNTIDSGVEPIVEAQQASVVSVVETIPTTSSNGHVPDNAEEIAATKDATHNEVIGIEVAPTNEPVSINIPKSETELFAVEIKPTPITEIQQSTLVSTIPEANDLPITESQPELPVSDEKTIHSIDSIVSDSTSEVKPIVEAQKAETASVVETIPASASNVNVSDDAPNILFTENTTQKEVVGSDDANDQDSIVDNKAETNLSVVEIQSKPTTENQQETLETTITEDTDRLESESEPELQVSNEITIHSNDLTVSASPDEIEQIEESETLEKANSGKVNGTVSIDVLSTTEESKESINSSDATATAVSQVQDNQEILSTNTETSSNTTNLISSTSKPTSVQDLTPTTPEVEIRQSGELYIGAIAEREHRKWENVEDVPGNPYSSEALQKRLSAQSLPREGDLTRLVNASHVPDVVSTPASAEPAPIDVPVIKPDISRYGRDYYINDAKHATGRTPISPSATNAIDDWQPITPVSSPVTASGDYELHTATPIFVANSGHNQPEEAGAAPASIADSQLTSSEDLSSLPPSSLTPSEGSDTTRVYDLTSRQTSLLQHDIIRCSRLPALEPATMQTPPASPIDARLEHRQTAKHYLKERSESFQQLAQFKRAIERNNQPISVTVKPLSSAQQYFGAARQPIKATTATTATKQSAMQGTEEIVAVSTAVPALSAVPVEQSVAEVTEPIVVDQQEQNVKEPELAEDIEVVEATQLTEVDLAVDVEVRQVTELMDVDQDVAQLSYTEPIIVSKGVIEEEVLPALPSVKALARSFINLQTTVDETPINRPKSLNWVQHHEDSTEEQLPRRFSQETVFPLYNQGYHPVAQHSITARSLSSKFRDELKETSEVRGRTSPDRPLSPVLVRGLLKNNIAFFENLNK